MHLLSAILEGATGMTALEFGRENLFEPLGIREVIWPVDPQGFNYGWGDLYLYPHDAAKITEQLSEQGIAYELHDGGTSIYVPHNEVYRLRLDLAKDGLPSGEQNGYKLFDDEKIGVSPFVQNVNLKRALQDELAKSIQMVDGVAHVHADIPSNMQIQDAPLALGMAQDHTVGVQIAHGGGIRRRHEH